MNALTKPLLRCSALLMLLPFAALADQTGEFGPPLGVSAKVVRAFDFKTKGAIDTHIVSDPEEENTGLVGLCNPKHFANFGIVHGSSYDQAEISIVSKAPVQTGMVGDIALDYVLVRFFDLTHDERRFKGKGVLKIKLHQAQKGKRKMIGSIVAKEMKGLAEMEGKTLSAEAQFELDFSCGIVH